MPRTTKNYRQKRDEAYREELPVGEQLDAVLKAFDMVLQSGGVIVLKKSIQKRTKGGE